MLLVDVHCHLNHERFKDDVDQVIERAKQAGVKAIICNGVNSATNKEVLKLAEKYNIVKPSLGIYPIDALNIQLPHLDEVGLTKDKFLDVDKEIKFIEKNKNKIIAIGEVGLDFKYLKEHEQKQRENFQKIIDLAKRIDKPLIVHSRNAEQTVLEMLESNNVKKVVLHSFGGRKSLIKKGTELGYHFSIPPVVKRLQHFEIVISLVPLIQLLTETDAPWLSPYPEKRNEPSFVIESIKKIAEVKKMTEEEVANNVFMNYQQLFG